MSKSKHTPEPWAKGFGLMGVHKADSARIVACVNALEGIDDPAEYTKTLAHTITLYEEENIRALKLERKLNTLSEVARALYESATSLPDDTEPYAPIDQSGTRRGEFTIRTNAAYVLRDKLSHLAAALAALDKS